MVRSSNCPRLNLLGWSAACLAVAVLGCGGRQREAQQREQSGLKALSVLYMQYASQHRGMGPASEAEFKAFIQKLPEAQRKSFHITDVDAAFVSARDGKPYVVVYGVKKMASPGPTASGSPVIGYEQVGAGGRRYVATAVGAVDEVDEATFKQRVPDAKTP